MGTKIKLISLIVLGIQVIKAQDVAFLIGGYSGVGDGQFITTEVEIYGCDDGLKRLPAPTPMRNYAMGAQFIDDGGDGYVLACGGTQCPEGGTCTSSDMCWVFDPTINDWIEQDPRLNQARFAFLLGEMADPDVPEQQVPLAVGFRERTEYLDPDDVWVEHFDLPEAWTNLNCLVQYNGLFYHVGNEVNRWDPADGSNFIFDGSSTPEGSVEVSKCVITEIDGEDGIFLRTGWFFNLEQELWQDKREGELPTPESTARPNELFSMNGRPTMFGSPRCDALNVCTYDQVIQYVWEENSWVMMDPMFAPRRFFELVNVPSSFCDLIPQDTPTTTQAPVTTEGPAPEGEVAIVIGGWADTRIDPDTRFGDIEIFGCPTEKRMGQTPLHKFLTASRYFNDNGDEYVLMCGGGDCNEGDAFCTITNACYEYRPGDNVWASVSPLNVSRLLHIMADVPLEDPSTNPENFYPMVIGDNEENEIRSPLGDWNLYGTVPDDQWASVQCFIQHPDLYIYHIGTVAVTKLDPVTFEPTVLASVPAEIADGVGVKCVALEIGGIPGIFTRGGNWFNLESNEWVQRTGVPVVGSNSPNAMFLLDGKPTVYGQPRCDALSTCFFDEVVQYQVDTDSWTYLGRMSMPRRLHEVIAVPGYWCDLIPDITDPTEPPFTTSDPSVTDTAAIIIGGYDYSNEQSRDLVDDVEIFGCDGGSRYVESFPYPGYGKAGTFVDDENGGYVLVCGGTNCTGGVSCDIMEKCFTWRPEDDEWIEIDDLDEDRLTAIMVKVPNIRTADQETLFPTVMGYRDNSEILLDGTWEQYEPIPDRSWIHAECFFQFSQYNNRIYHIRDEITELDPLTWTFRTLGEAPLPRDLRSPLKCAGAVINGNPGIFTREGNFFNLISLEWESYREAPRPNVANIPNALFGYELKPTLFGTAECNALDVCRFDKVIQYNDDFEDWVIIGTMLTPRRLHEVVEVPKTFCDRLPPRTTVEPPTTSDPSTTLSPEEDTAMVMIGGYYAGPIADILDSVEIFGCSDETSYNIDTVPYRNYLVGSTYIDDGSGGYILSCGGIFCPGGSCFPSTSCYQWRPDSDMNWEPTSTTNMSHFANVIFELPNINNAGDTDVYPTILGNGVETEIFDPSTNEWSLYEEIPNGRWSQLECFIYFQDMIYIVSDDGVLELDPTTWDVTTISDAEVPEDELGQHKCVGTYIDDVPVIFTLKSNVFNLNTNEWLDQIDMPEQTYRGAQNSLWSYQDRPTMFGAPFCNALNECYYEQIIQYRWEEDEWILLGSMREPRRFHEAVEVPSSFCSILDDISTSSTTTTTTLPTTTNEPPREETAAIVIGGYIYGPDAGISDQVELFGCDGGSQFVAPLEYRNFLMGATYIEDEQGGYVLACGGTQCIEGSCGLSDLCYEWRPQENVWTQTSLLNEPRYGHLLAMVPNINLEEDDTLYPAAVGYLEDSEIYFPGNSSWLPYEPIPDRFWVTLDCLIQYRNMIYHIDDGVITQIDPSQDWQVTVLGRTPEGVTTNTLKCAGTVINGFPGIFTRDGDWLNLRTLNWEKFSPVPDNCEANRPNAMWSYQGKPTVFGAPYCDSLARCYFNQVIQYQPEQDRWTIIGNLQQPRRSHEVVEVPKSFCDLLNSDRSLSRDEL